MRWMLSGAALFAVLLLAGTTHAEHKHWAFNPPRRPAVAATHNSTWSRSAIDSFILARLEAEGLTPSAEADRYALARRAAIDLIGLPPTLAEVDRFVNDPAPDAFERYLDRLLASPRFGERWAHVWLDLARYADSKGYADDGLRTIWKYRDWVIDAINANKPFDKFTIEQIAGDQLSNPTQDQLLASAFHRNTLTNDEGGTDKEEFRVAAVVDRVNTTMQVWMGITIGCAQCHNHKFDPISQEEYYRLFAIFNQTEDANTGDDAPLVTSISTEDQQKKTALEAELAELQKQLNQTTPELDAAQEKWEKEGNQDKTPPNIKTILAVEREKRTDAQKAELTKHFRSIAPELKGLRDKIASVQGQIKAVSGITTPIMRELADGKKRKTYVHIRGDFLNKGKEVTPGLPAVFAPPADRPLNRLSLAQWLVDADNPLTARVTVNRYWEQIFGAPLMETPEDWGVRSKPPLHPEMLDWLAVEFRESGWDVKKLLKLMVTSSTYRQSARITPELLEKDPSNRLLARGPRYRSSAEVVRDQALSSTGLLSERMYGPSVRPPRPRLNLNAAFGGATDWETSAGEDKFRRALYTQWRRTTPYPSMVTFDAPSRNVCTITRPRTNTPLQALVALNDPVFVEAAQALARRIVREGGATLEERTQYGFRLCLVRPPRDIETRRLMQLFQTAHEQYAKDPAKAKQMAEQPIGPTPDGMDVIDLAAWTVVGNVLLNLDEVLMKR